MKNSISSHPEEGFNLLYAVLKEVIYDSLFWLKQSLENSKFFGSFLLV